MDKYQTRDTVYKPNQLKRFHLALVLVLLFALVLVIRLHFLGISIDRNWPHSVLYEGDAPHWVRWAEAIDQGVPFEFDLPLWPPGTAYIIAALQPTFSFHAMKIVWCVIGALVVPLAFLTWQRQVPMRVALIAGGLATFSFGGYVISTSLNNEVWYALVVVCLVLGTDRLKSHPTFLLAGALGITHGLATLLRAEHSLLLLFMLAWSWWMMSRGDHATTLKRSIILTITTLILSIIVCLPWSIAGSRHIQAFNSNLIEEVGFDSTPVKWTADARNYVNNLPAFARSGNVAFMNALALQNGRRIIDKPDVESFFLERFNSIPEPISPIFLVSAKGPLDFALANHLEGNGGFSLRALDDSQGKATTLTLGRPSHLELFNHGISHTLSDIVNHPTEWFGLVWQKLERFWGGVTLGMTSRNIPLGLNGQRNAVDLFTPHSRNNLWWNIVIGTFLVIGLITALRRGGVGLWILVIGYKLTVTILFYGYARQAVSIMPAFAILIALGIDAGLIPLLRFKIFSRLLPIAGIVALITLLMLDLSNYRESTFDIRPINADEQITVHPEYGAGAFECPTAIEVRKADTQ